MSAVEEGMAVALTLNRQPLVLAEVLVSVGFWKRGLGVEQEAATVSRREKAFALRPATLRSGDLWHSFWVEVSVSAVAEGMVVVQAGSSLSVV